PPRVGAARAARAGAGAPASPLRERAGVPRRGARAARSGAAMSDGAKELSDAALARLRGILDEPDLSGTRYELVESIGRKDPSPVGRGAFSAVGGARDRLLERAAALKVLAPRAPAGVAERLVAEAKILARLDHPGIVPVHDAGTLEDGRV